MLRIIGNAAISGGLTWLLWTSLFGHGIGMRILAGLLAFGIFVLTWLAEKPDYLGFLDRIGGRENPPPGKLKVFGHIIERPALLDTAGGMFDRKYVDSAYYLNTKEEIKTAGIPPLKRSQLNEARMLESMMESARYEAARRGTPPRDRLNNIVWPKLYQNGLVVEEATNDDGSTSVILAVGLLATLNRAQWQEAYAADIGTHNSAWDQHPHALVGVGKIGPNLADRREFDKPGNAAVMPLYNLKLREIVIPAEKVDDAQSDTVALDMPDDWK